MKNNQMLIRTFPVTNRIVIKLKPRIKLAISKSFHSFSLRRNKDAIYDQRLKKSQQKPENHRTLLVTPWEMMSC